MLFHVTHTHDYQTCMAHREDARKEFNDGFIEAAAANNVQILATYNNRGRQKSRHGQSLSAPAQWPLPPENPH